ncbi:MAG: hypothetical protein HYY06_06025 [Deltaproteobacteria bacterium]|nr:hypothetical protein [Deltaproteobacteria bacterium]
MRAAFLFPTAMLAGCSLFGSQPQAPAPPPSIGTFHLLSDVDVIQDIATTSTDLWVATSRGIVRHPLSGGDPVRIGEAEGLPSPDVVAIAANDTAAWAATPAGLVKIGANGVERLPDTPAVGTPTALAIGDDGAIWVGGTAGLGRGDGTTWQKYTDRYHVTSIATEAGGIWLGTKQSGAVRLSNGVFFEHTISIGLPANFVRSVVSLGSGQAFALCQTASGSSLGWFDGTRWYSYTVPVEQPLLGLTVLDAKPVVYTTNRLYRIARTEEDEGTQLIPIANPGEGNARQFRARPEAVQPGSSASATPAAPPEPPAVEAPPARPAAGPATPARGAAPAGGLRSLAPDGQATQGAAGRAPAAGQTPVPAGRAPAAGRAAPVGPAAPAEAAPEAADYAAGLVPSEIAAPPAAPAAAETLAPAVRPLAPAEGQEFEAPRWLVTDEGSSPLAKIMLVRARGSAVYVATLGLGVSRFEGRRETPYRTRDLVVTDRPFSIGSDPSGQSWILTRAHEAARFDGERIERVIVDPDPAIKMMAFTSGPGAVFALGHAANTDWWRCYRSEGGAFRLVVERQLQAETGVTDVSFFAVDSGGRFWLGIKARMQSGAIVERGAAVIDANSPSVVYHHSRANPATDGQGAMRIPDSVSAIAFAQNGEIWLAGLDGAARIAGGEITRFGESQGLEGELVGDLDVAPGGVPYIATPEGIGHFEGTRWGFERNSVVTQFHPIALAIDGQGHVWAGGSRGALYGNGQTWRRIGRGDGLLSEQLTDIRVDGSNRVWFVTGDGLTVLERR